MNDNKNGVDLDLGNSCSANAYAWAKKTFINRVDKPGEALIGLDGAFSNILKFGNNRIGISSDGIGTKIELAERTGIYDTLGFDLVAMVTDDLAANGFEATNISNILDVDVLHTETVDKLMRGLYNAANQAGISVTGGEIAELGNRIAGYGNGMHFNWCSTAIGILPPELDSAIDGSTIKKGDLVISLKSSGFRSNGFSLIRRILTEKFGSEWHSHSFNSQKTWGEILLTPSRIFCNLITELLKNKHLIHGIVHITGGGIPDNLARVLRQNKLGADLDNVFEPADFMLQIQKLGKIDERNAYRFWNMGNGMLLIVPEENVENLLKTVLTYNYVPKIAGKITAENEVILQTKGVFPEKLIYPV